MRALLQAVNETPETAFGFLQSAELIAPELFEALLNDVPELLESRPALSGRDQRNEMFYLLGWVAAEPALQVYVEHFLPSLKKALFPGSGRQKKKHR